MKESGNTIRKSMSVKSVALLTLVAFISTQAFIPAPVSLAKTPDPVVQVANAGFAIPPELGKIEEVYFATTDQSLQTTDSLSVRERAGVRGQSLQSPVSSLRSGFQKTIVFVQDAHDSLEAQENIAKIINLLVKEKGVRTVFEEGYEGAVPTDKFFGFIKDPAVKQKVSYFLLDKLRIGGAEYAHINRANPAVSDKRKEISKNGKQKALTAYNLPLSADWQLIGVDNLKLYSENIGAYQRASANRQETEEDLRELFSQITVLANQYFPQDLKTLLKAKERFGARKLPLLDYLNVLRKIYLGASNLTPSPLSSPPERGRGKGEGEAFSVEYPATSLLLTAQASRDRKLIEQLNALDSKVVFGEMVRLEKDVSGAFLKGDRDRRIFDYYQGLELLRRLNRIEVTQDEYEALLAYSVQRTADRKNGNSKTLHASRSTLNANLQRSALSPQSSALFNTQGMVDFIVSQTHKSLVLSKSWEQHIQDAVRFYDVARSRDRSLAKALGQHFAGQTTDQRLQTTDSLSHGERDGVRGQSLQSPVSSLQSSKSLRNETAILVYGGFHANAIKEILKEQGVSYVVISPRITSIDKKHQDYYKQLMSVGHHSFEMPFLVTRASKPPGIFHSAVASGEAAGVRSELRAITSSVEALGDHSDSQLIEQRLGSLNTHARSEMRDPELSGGISLSVEEIEGLKALKAKDDAIIQQLAVLMRHSDDPAVKESAGRKIVEEALGDEYETLRLEAFSEILPTMIAQINLPRPSEGEVDLHTHSYWSDAYDTPTGYILHAFEEGLRGVAITDHNHLPGEEVGRAAKILNEKIRSVNEKTGRNVSPLTLIPGIEATTIFEGAEVHLLLYMPRFFEDFVGAKKKAWESYTNKLANARGIGGVRGERIMKWINAHYPEFSITLEDLNAVFRYGKYNSGVGDAIWNKYKDDAVGQKHLAKYHIKSGKDVWYNFIVPNVTVKSLSEEERGKYPQLKELLAFANSMGAKIAVAHPNEIIEQKKGVFEHLLQELSQAVSEGEISPEGILGAELYSHKLARSPHKDFVLQHIEHLNAADLFYSDHPLLAVPGSDSHGQMSWPSNPLGRFVKSSIYPSDVSAHSKRILDALTMPVSKNRSEIRAGEPVESAGLEYLDLVDESDMKTGERVLRKLAHKSAGLRHRASILWIFNRKGEVLIQRRGLQKDTFPGVWAPGVAGHVDSGQEYGATAQIESAEEIGLTLNPEKLQVLGPAGRPGSDKQMYLFQFQRSDRPQAERLLGSIRTQLIHENVLPAVSDPRDVLWRVAYGKKGEITVYFYRATKELSGKLDSGYPRVRELLAASFPGITERVIYDLDNRTHYGYALDAREEAIVAASAKRIKTEAEQDESAEVAELEFVNFSDLMGQFNAMPELYVDDFMQIGEPAYRSDVVRAVIAEQWKVLAADKTTGLKQKQIPEVLAAVANGSLKLKSEDVDIIKAVNGREVVIGAIDRNIAHRHGLLHRVPTTFIVTPEGKFLLQRRAHNIVEPLRMSLFGGHVKAGHNYWETIKDEIVEELGLPKDWKVDDRRLKVIREEGSFRSPEWDKSNREHRSYYVYFASDEEVLKIRETGRQLEKKRNDLGEAGYKQWLEAEQKNKSGYGEVWAVHELNYDELMALGADELSSDLLAPLLDLNNPANLRGFLRHAAARRTFEIFDPKEFDIHLVALTEPSGKYEDDYEAKAGLMHEREGKVSVVPSYEEKNSALLNPVKVPWGEHVEKAGISSEKVTLISYQDLYHNDWFVAFDGRKGTLLHGYGEPFSERAYSMFVRWTDGTVTSEDLRFVQKQGEESGRVEVYRENDVRFKEPLTSRIQFAVFGQRLIHKGEIVPAENFAAQFSDVFQLYRYPEYLSKDEGGGKFGDPFVKIFRDVVKHPMLPQERNILWNAIKNDGYVELDLSKLLADPKFSGLSWEAIKQKALNGRGYKEVSERSKEALAEGEYHVKGETLYIRLRPFPYPHDLIGITKSHKAVAIVLPGDKTKNQGYAIPRSKTVPQLQQVIIDAMEEKGDPIQEVFLLANSKDAFLWQDGQIVKELSSAKTYSSGSAGLVFVKKDNVAARSEIRKMPGAELRGVAEAWVIRNSRTGAEKGLAYQAPLLPKGTKNSDAGWRDFNEMIFEFPKLLERAAKKKLPVVLVVPEKLDGFGPLADEAPWIEGARTALAWASAYFRFKELGNVDVRVLQLPETRVSQDQIANAVKVLFSRKIQDAAGTPEEQMEARIFRLEVVLKTTSTKKSELLLESRAIDVISGVKKNDAEPEMIRPDLQPVPVGNKRIVVTGAAGFIGINLVKKLLAEGHQVIALDDLISANKDFSSFFQKEPNLYFRKWDVSEPFDIEGPVDQVIHLASLASPPDYYVRPLETLRSGLQATRVTVELALRHHAQFLFTSTSEVYGDAKVHPQGETYAGNVSPFKKRSQYDQSKRGAETLMKLYAERYAGETPDFRIARLFNTYGPFMRLDDGRAVTNFIEKLLTNRPIQIYGSEKITRSFGYIEDTLNGLLKLLRTDKLTSATPIQDRVFNVGNDAEFTLGELADLVNGLGKKHLNRTVPVHVVGAIDPSDPVRRRPDLTRARVFLGYAPNMPFRDGLERTFLYFLNARSETRLVPAVFDLEKLVPEKFRDRPIAIDLIADNTGTLTLHHAQPQSDAIRDGLIKLLSNDGSRLIMNTGDDASSVVGSQRALIERLTQTGTFHRWFVTSAGGTIVSSLEENGALDSLSIVKPWPLDMKKRLSNALVNAFYDQVLHRIQAGKIPVEGSTSDIAKARERALRDIQEKTKHWEKIPDGESRNKVTYLLPDLLGRDAFIYDSGAKMAIDTVIASRTHPWLNHEFFEAVAKAVKKTMAGTSERIEFIPGLDFLDVSALTKLDGVQAIRVENPIHRENRLLLTAVIGDGLNDLPVLNHSFAKADEPEISLSVALSHHRAFASGAAGHVLISNGEKMDGAAEVLAWLNQIQGKTVRQLMAEQQAQLKLQTWKLLNDAEDTRADRLQKIKTSILHSWDGLDGLNRAQKEPLVAAAIKALHEYRLADALILLAGSKPRDEEKQNVLRQLTVDFPLTVYSAARGWNGPKVDLEEQTALFRGIEHAINEMLDWGREAAVSASQSESDLVTPVFWVGDPHYFHKKQLFEKGMNHLQKTLESLFPTGDLGIHPAWNDTLESVVPIVLHGNQTDDLSRAPEVPHLGDHYLVDHRMALRRLLDAESNKHIAIALDNLGGESFSLLLTAWLLLRMGKTVTLFAKKEPMLFNDATVADLKYSVDVFDQILRGYFEGSPVPLLADSVRSGRLFLKEVPYDYTYQGEQVEGRKIVSHSFDHLGGFDVAIMMGELQYGDFMRGQLRRVYGTALDSEVRSVADLNPFSRTNLVLLKANKNFREVNVAVESGRYRPGDPTRGELVVQVFPPSTISAQRSEMRAEISGKEARHARVKDLDVEGEWALPGVKVQQEHFDRVSVMSEEYHSVVHVNINEKDYAIGHGEYLVLTLPSKKKIYWSGQHNLSYSLFFKHFDEQAEKRLGSILWRHADQHADENPVSFDEKDIPKYTDAQRHIEFGLQTLNAANYLGFIKEQNLARVVHAATAEELAVWNSDPEEGGVLDIDLDILMAGKLQDGKVLVEQLAKAAATSEVVFITNSSEREVAYLASGAQIPRAFIYLKPVEGIPFGIDLVKEIAKQDLLHSDGGYEAINRRPSEGVSARSETRETSAASTGSFRQFSKSVFSVLFQQANKRSEPYPIARVAAAFVPAGKSTGQTAYTKDTDMIATNSRGVHEHSEMNLIVKILEEKTKALQAGENKKLLEPNIAKMKDIIRWEKLGGPISRFTLDDAKSLKKAAPLLLKKLSEREDSEKSVDLRNKLEGIVEQLKADKTKGQALKDQESKDRVVDAFNAFLGKPDLYLQFEGLYDVEALFKSDNGQDIQKNYGQAKVPYALEQSDILRLNRALMVQMGCGIPEASDKGMQLLTESLKLLEKEGAHPFKGGDFFITLIPCKQCARVLKKLELGRIVYAANHPHVATARKWKDQLEGGEEEKGVFPKNDRKDLEIIDLSGEFSDKQSNSSFNKLMKFWNWPQDGHTRFQKCMLRQLYVLGEDYMKRFQDLIRKETFDGRARNMIREDRLLAIISFFGGVASDKDVFILLDMLVEGKIPGTGAAEKRKLLGDIFDRNELLMEEDIYYLEVLKERLPQEDKGLVDEVSGNIRRDVEGIWRPRPFRTYKLLQLVINELSLDRYVSNLNSLFHGKGWHFDRPWWKVINGRGYSKIDEEKKGFYQILSKDEFMLEDFEVLLKERVDKFKEIDTYFMGSDPSDRAWLKSLNKENIQGVIDHWKEAWSWMHVARPFHNAFRRPKFKDVISNEVHHSQLDRDMLLDLVSRVGPSEWPRRMRQLEKATEIAAIEESIRSDEKAVEFLHSPQKGEELQEFKARFPSLYGRIEKFAKDWQLSVEDIRKFGGDKEVIKPFEKCVRDEDISREIDVRAIYSYFKAGINLDFDQGRDPKEQRMTVISEDLLLRMLLSQGMFGRDISLNELLALENKNLYRAFCLYVRWQHGFLSGDLNEALKKEAEADAKRANGAVGSENNGKNDYLQIELSRLADRTVMISELFKDYQEKLEKREPDAKKRKEILRTLALSAQEVAFMEDSHQRVSRIHRVLNPLLLEAAKEHVGNSDPARHIFQKPEEIFSLTPSQVIELFEAQDLRHIKKNAEKWKNIAKITSVLENFSEKLARETNEGGWLEAVERYALKMIKDVFPVIYMQHDSAVVSGPMAAGYLWEIDRIDVRITQLRTKAEQRKKDIDDLDLKKKIEAEANRSEIRADVPRNVEGLDERLNKLGIHEVSDKTLRSIYQAAIKINPEVDLRALSEVYEKFRKDLKPIIAVDKVVERGSVSAINLYSSYSKYYSEKEINHPLGNAERQIDRDDMLDVLKNDFRIPQAYKIQKSNYQIDLNSQAHYASSSSSEDLFVTTEFSAFVALYLAAGDKTMREVVFPLKTELALQERTKSLGISEAPDEAFRSIYEAVTKVNPQVDLRALYDLYKTVAQWRGAGFEDPTGKISLGKLVTDEHDRYGGEDYERVVTEGSFLEFLRDEIIIPDVYLLQTASESYPRPGSTGDTSLNPDHYYTQTYEDFYVAPKEFDAILRFCVLAKNFPLREILLGDVSPYRAIAQQGIRYLGKEGDLRRMGGKESGFLLFDRLSLPYPPGIVLSADLIEKLFAMSPEKQLLVMEYVFESLAKTGIDLAGTSFAVRSNPVKSMPGRLATQVVTPLGMDVYEAEAGQKSAALVKPEDLLRAIQSVRGSWDSDKAEKYRRHLGLEDEYDMSIIIQKWIPPFSFLRGAPLCASGVFSTRNPNTNENVLWGRYKINAAGDSLMTRGEAGSDVNEFAARDPLVYQQLRDAKTKLEEAARPQEVEFVVRHGTLFFTQTRALAFSPQGEISYLRELLAAKKINEAKAIPKIEALQKKMAGRKIYRIKEGVRLEPIARAEASTSGAFKGFLAFSIDQAKLLMSEGKPVIFFAREPSDGDQFLLSLFDYPRLGLITRYGNGSSHEAVLTRLSGIPALINLDVSKLNEGDEVVIDGDKGVLYQAPKENVLEDDGTLLDASYGVDIPLFKRDFLKGYIDENMFIKHEFTISKLEEMNQVAAERFRQLDAASDRKAAFIANLEKHFLHELLLLRQEGKTIFVSRSEARVDVYLVNLISPMFIDKFQDPQGINTVAAYVRAVNPEIKISTWDMYGRYEDSKEERQKSWDQMCDDVVRAIIAAKPKVVGFSVKWGSVEILDAMMKKLDSQMGKNRPLVVLGNTGPTFAYKEFLERYQDYGPVIAVVGEGEAALEEIATIARKSRNYRDVELYKGILNVAVPRGGKPKVKALDLKSYPMTDSGQAAELLEGGTGIETSRGCPWGVCEFCSLRGLYGLGQGKWRAFSLDQVEHRMEQFLKKGRRSFYIIDSEFMGDVKSKDDFETTMGRAQEFAERVMALNEKYPRENEPIQISVLSVRADNLIADPARPERQRKIDEVFRDLKKAGLKRIYLGIESGDPDQFMRYKKGPSKDADEKPIDNVERNRRAIQKVRELGFDLEVGFIFSGPQDGIRTLKNNVKFIESTKLYETESRVFGPLRVQAGSGFEGKFRNNGLLGDQLDLEKLSYSARHLDSKVEEVENLFLEWEKASYNLLKYLRHAKPVYRDQLPEEERNSQINAIQTILLQGREMDFRFMKEIVSAYPEEASALGAASDLKLRGRLRAIVERFVRERETLFKNIQDAFDSRKFEDDRGLLAEKLQDAREVNADFEVDGIQRVVGKIISHRSEIRELVSSWTGVEGSMAQNIALNSTLKSSGASKGRRSETRTVPFAFEKAVSKVRGDGAEAMVRTIRKNVQPATVFVDAADLGNLSPAQKQEYLFVALSNKAVRIIVYNEHGQARDKQLDAFLKSDRVTRTDQDLNRALAIFGKENMPTIHLSKEVLPASEVVRSLGKRVMFFKQHGEKGGTLAVALLWAISGAEKARLAGVSLEKDGFWTVAETLLSGIQKAYESSLVFAIAA